MSTSGSNVTAYGRRSALGLAAAAGLGTFLPTGPAWSQTLPAYYPEDYKQIIEASKKENSLLVYSVLAQYNWAPVIQWINPQCPPPADFAMR